MCATDEQFLRLNSTASINLNPKICYFLRVPWQPSCFWNTIWHVTSIAHTVPIVPADLAHAASDIRVHHDDQQRNEDQVGIAEDVFQQQKLKPVQMIKTKHNGIENKKTHMKMNWAPEDDPLGQVEIGEVCADGEAGQYVGQTQVPPPVRSLHRGTLGPEAPDGLVSLKKGRQCGPWELRGKQITS